MLNNTPESEYTLNLHISRSRDLQKKHGLSSVKMASHGLQAPHIVKALIKNIWHEIKLRNLFDNPYQQRQYQQAGINNKFNHIDFEISIHYVSNIEIQAYNLQYRGKDYATNILTFTQIIPQITPEKTPKKTLQILQTIDLILAPAVIIEEAPTESKSVFDHFAHLYLHGLLHGLGFDHENELDANAMEALEIDILAAMGFVSPY